MRRIAAVPEAELGAGWIAQTRALHIGKFVAWMGVAPIDIFVVEDTDRAEGDVAPGDDKGVASNDTPDKGRVMASDGAPGDDRFVASNDAPDTVKGTVSDNTPCQAMNLSDKINSRAGTAL